MTQTIRIKRSTGAAAPASLAQGELAYSHGSMTFYVGDPGTADTPVPIGGAIINNAGTATLATGVLASQVRSLIGAGTGDGTVTDEPAVINSAGSPTLGAGVTAAEVRTLLDVDPAGADNSTNVTLNTVTYDYLSISGQQITLNAIDAATDITGLAAIATSGNLADASGDTDDVAEGTNNLYHTVARARAALRAGTGVSLASGEISIGQDIGTGATPTFAGMVLNGDLDITGNINSSSTTELMVEDNAIYLNSTYAGSSPTLDASFEVERGTVSNARIVWNETADRWELDSGSGTAAAILTAGQAGVDELSTNAGLGSLSGQEGSVTITLDLSELPDMTGAVSGAADEAILLDAGVQKRKALSEIALSAFNNDMGWNNYTHPSYAGDDLAIDTGPLTGATVISDIDINLTSDAQGHVTDANASVATRTLAPANIGAATAAQGTKADTALQTLTLSSTDGSVTGVGASTGTTPTFDLEVGTIDGGTY